MSIRLPSPQNRNNDPYDIEYLIDISSFFSQNRDGHLVPKNQGQGTFITFFEYEFETLKTEIWLIQN